MQTEKKEKNTYNWMSKQLPKVVYVFSKQRSKGQIKSQILEKDGQRESITAHGKMGSSTNHVHDIQEKHQTKLYAATD